MPFAEPILLVDDHNLIREGIKGVLIDAGFQIIHEAANGEDALKALEKHNSRLVLMDINMEPMGGIECTKIINEKFPLVKVIALTQVTESQYVKQMLEAGANGYVLKNASKNELLLAIDSVLKGKSYFGNEVEKAIMDFYQNKNTAAIQEAPLTKREKEIIELIVQEKDNREIAEELFLSIRTVETHKRNILEKTGCKNIAGLVLYALRHNLASI